MQHLDIEPLRPEDVTEAGSVLASAMHTNPVNAAVFGGGSDEPARLLQEKWFGVALERRREGTLVAKEKGRLIGVICMAMWPACSLSAPQAQAIVPMLQSQFGDLTPRIIEWRTVWSENDHPEPHWHLGPMAVAPAEQGRGIGSRMLQWFCDHVDSQGEAAFLETDKPENVRLYERFGFTIVGEASVLGATTWFMLRPAQ